jgi:hypothetical protein
MNIDDKLAIHEMIAQYSYAYDSQDARSARGAAPSQWGGEGRSWAPERVAAVASRSDLPGMR